MTPAEKQSIEKMRSHGAGYMIIAETLGISVNTVKSYCRRKSISIASKETGNEEPKAESKNQCKQCEKPLNHKPGGKPKKFCSDACRSAWWNAHRSDAAVHTHRAMSCLHCKSAFYSTNQKRKFCSHTCYIAKRYRKEQAHGS